MRRKPQLMATDQGATRGDGVFESLLAVGGRPRKLQAHLDPAGRVRPAAGAGHPRARTPGGAPSTTAIGEYRRQHLPGAAAADGRGRGEAARDPRRRRAPPRPPAGSRPPPPAPPGGASARPAIDVILLDRGYDSEVGERAPWLLLGAKTLSYAVNMAALRYAHPQGADDVIFTSADGRVLEGPTSTVLLAHLETSDDGAGGVRTIRRLITPQLDSGILPGTSQGALFTAAKAAGWELGYGPLEPQDLLDADAVWLISSIRLLAPVNHIDGKEIGTPELRRQLTAELNALYATIE